MDPDFALDLIIELFDPLASALEDSSAEVHLLRELGFVLPEDSNLLGGLRSTFESLVDTVCMLDELPADADPVEDMELFLSTVGTVRSAVKAVNDLADLLDPGVAGSEFVTTTDVLEVLPRRLVDYLVSRAIRRQLREVHAVLSFMGVIEETFVEVEESEYCVSFVERIIHWDRLPLIFGDLAALLEMLYGWGTADVDVTRLLGMLHNLALAFYLDAEVDAPASRAMASFNAMLGDGSGHIEDSDDLTILRIPFVPAMRSALGCEIYPVRSSTGGVDGFGVGIYVDPDIDLTSQLTEEIALAITLSSEVEPGFGFIVRAGQDIAFVSSVFGEETGAVLQSPLEAKITFDYKPVIGKIVVGDSRATHLAFESVSTSLGVVKRPPDPDEFYVEFAISHAALVVQVREGDSFLQRSLPGGPLRIEFDVVLGLSNQRGIHIGGGVGLEHTLFINRSLGPVLVNAIHAGLSADDQKINLAVALTGGLDFGPLVATVQNIGIQTWLEFHKPGVLGTADISLCFKPPDGVGLAIEASGITGGGSLEFDHANQRYAGVLALNFGEIGLTAIGLITTRLPDGSPGFALLINIGVTFDPPIQLSFGFTLSGVGGLVGVNRSMQIDVLRRGLKNRTLDSILFPDPDTVIANAPKIISDLRVVFPPADGRYVVGPMVKIGWGSPNIITADVGVFVEFPDPIRIVLMGQVAAALPQEKEALVVIHLDILGVVDFAKEELTFQACLYDSRIMSYSLSGDSAFLLGWGRNPRFALALGGFHPRFTPPPPPIVFADLKRLALSISKAGGALQLSCQAYQALTPNSLQFGAKVSLHASAGGLTAEGNLGFDALFYFSPFSFEVEICGGVYIKYKSVSLLDVHLTLFLSGPTPWHARGKAKIKILFASISVGFNETWGSDEQDLLPPADPWGLLQDALADPGNWGSLLPAGRPTVASLRSLETEEPAGPVVHPAGRLEVRQKVVPLGVRLDKVGNAPITGPDLFDITDLCVNGESLRPLDPVEEFFARGQFEELTADQKLSLPAFEKIKGGVTTAASAGVRIDGDPEPWTLAYESILINPDRTSQRQEPEGQVDWFDWQHAELIVKSHATRRAAQRAGLQKQFFTLRPQPMVEAGEERYCIAKASNLTPADLDPALGQDNGGMTRILADQVLKAQLEHRPDQAGELLVIPECEVAA